MYDTSYCNKSSADGNPRSIVRKQCDIDKCYLKSQQYNSNPLERRSILIPIHETSPDNDAIHSPLLN